MKRSKINATLLLTVAALVVVPRIGEAQARGGCSTAPPRAIGLSLGRSAPYVELSPDVVGADRSGSIMVRSGVQFGGRLDVPVVGPWRARLEGSTVGWRVVEQHYGSDGRIVTADDRGHLTAREFVALFGRQGGRSPVCGYVLAGGGLYFVQYGDGGLARPGVALTAGIEIPTGSRSAIQAEMQLHVISTHFEHPVDAADVPAAGILLGWSYRF